MSTALPKPPEIKVTKAYKIFKILDENRAINKSHQNKLMKAINDRDLLHLFPIIVNKKMEVIEGQHRLRSAECLSRPIYYIIDNTVTGADIAMVNTNRKGWSGKDYIRYYAHCGNEDYKKIQKLITAFSRITLMTAIRLCNEERHYLNGGGQASRDMRTGKITAPNVGLAHKIGQLCSDWNKRLPYTYQGPFMLAMKNAILQSGLPHDKAIGILDGKRNMFPRMIAWDETCLQLMKDILPNEKKPAYA